MKIKDIMKTIYKTGTLMLAIVSLLLSPSCKKDWLDAKPNKALVVPSTVADYQALLDNSANMNTQSPALSMVGDGDYYITDAVYNSLSQPFEKGAYSWAATGDFYGGQRLPDWTVAYQRILQANVVLDGLPSLPVTSSTQAAYDNVLGSALFYRSFDFYCLAQQYCKPYNASTAATDLGLPLRLSSNVNLQVSRATLQMTYDQMAKDLQHALRLLPNSPRYRTRPSRPAAYALLARIYLAQENYGTALLYADSCLQLQHTLMDFNQLKIGAYDPGIPVFNPEVIYWTQLSMFTTTDNYVYIADPALTGSYAANDLRNSIFFFTYGGHKAFWGTYIGDGYHNFGGIATDEMYLVRAECYARTDNVNAAMSDLNTLLRTRWKTGTYVDQVAPSADGALSLILAERRKELCFRNIRWSDLRRLNKDSRFQVTLTRNINGQTLTLPPNSPRYVLPLDPIETTVGGLTQNQR
jgi:tetratricopeptide (TPR) repeat protein